MPVRLSPSLSPSIDAEVVPVAKRRRFTKADKRRIGLLIADDAIKKLIQERGIILTTWKELKERRKKAAPLE